MEAEADTMGEKAMIKERKRETERDYRS